MRPQVKEELGEEGKSSIMAELGKRWKELKEDDDRADELAEYTKMAADDKARYEGEKTNAQPSEQEENESPSPKKKGKAKTEDVSTDDEKATAKKKTKEVPKKEESEKTSPKKKTGYICFCKHNRDGIKKDNPGMSAQDITRTLAGLWKELNKEEQKAWNDSATDME